MKHKKLITLLMMALLPVAAFAQFDEATSKMEAFRDFVYTAAPIGFVIALLGGALFNIGKIWGENRDWKGFFTSLGLFVLAIAFIVGITVYLTSLRFG
jgi:hypothetical protein